ncbi:hypothetical protein FocTR4_00010971 [Fusarium oxysporum f. sp. cubense]|uniref:Uncharacterized protein n=1 Tax=Fusarium oxysporum f. sp. cubense TaxID=61366 RepID=A0A5C6SDQ0_FUSOC|nr:hypothetical protein FocTR4_00010971 [Fusarium oxysporum f. sp. cubense]
MPQSDSEHQEAAHTEETCPGTTYKYLSPEQQEISDILYKMEGHDLDLLGIVHLGRDGIFRYLDADRNIHYAIALRPALIKALLDRGPYDKEEEIVFRILPEPLSEEHRKEGQELIKKNKEKINRNREASKNYKERLVYIESDHKLE